MTAKAYNIHALFRIGGTTRPTMQSALTGL